MSVKFIVIIFGLTLSFASRGQDTINGLVYDKTGPIPGVVVNEVGTDNKVSTDAKGEFKITTKTSRPTLTFTFIGFYPRTISVKKKKTIKVKMKFDRPKYKDIARSNDCQQCAYFIAGCSVAL